MSFTPIRSGANTSIPIDGQRPARGERTRDPAEQSQRTSTCGGLFAGLNCFKSAPPEHADESRVRSGLPRTSNKRPDAGRDAGGVESASTSGSSSLQTEAMKRAEMKLRRLEGLLSYASPEPVIPGQSLETPGSVETLAAQVGVPAQHLESHLQREMASFCDAVPSAGKQAELMEVLYRLSAIGQGDRSHRWLEKLKSFDSFVQNFCPQATGEDRARLMIAVKQFSGDRLPLMFQDEDRVNRAQPVYGEPGNWVRLNRAWVDSRVVEEARQLLQDGFAATDGLLVHSTGSAALPGIGRREGLLAAAQLQQRGAEIATGEFAFYPGAHGAWNAGMSNALEDIFATDRLGMSSVGYATQRWFDETPVAFGISPELQRGHNDAAEVSAKFKKTSEGIAIGPAVPLDNIVTVSGSKNSEAMVTKWIAAHCPQARFVSFEAAELLNRLG